jgi:hypothetical protein
MSWLVVVVVVVVGLTGAFYWPMLFGAAIRGEFRVSIYERVEKILRAHEGREASAEALLELEALVDRAARDAMLELGNPDDGLSFHVRNDDVLGPICVVKTADGLELSLAEFERRLQA